MSARHARGQFAAGGATAGADEPMLLVFGNERLDVRQFPDLLAERLGIGALEGFAATSAGARHARHALLALRAGKQGSCVFVMAWLTAA